MQEVLAHYGRYHSLAGGPGLHKRLDNYELARVTHQAAFLPGFCSRICSAVSEFPEGADSWTNNHASCLQVLPCVPALTSGNSGLQPRGVGRNTPFPPLSCFQAVFYHSHREEARTFCFSACISHHTNKMKLKIK